MDLVLEVLDTWYLDKLYADVFPKSIEQYIPPTPHFVSGLVSAIDNTTSESTGLGSSLAKGAARLFHKKGREIYGYNAPYVFYDESPWAHASYFERYSIFRESLSLFVVTTIFAWFLYYAMATFSFYTIYDHTLLNHPRYLKNQIKMEQKLAFSAIPVMVLLTIPWFLLDIHGYSKTYWSIGEGKWKFIFSEIVVSILLTDLGIYFIHRWLHWPRVYKLLHKPHHKWIVCTPYASHAFHPVDGYAQSLPYHWVVMLFPIQKVVFLALFAFINLWTVSIHDGFYVANDPYVNGAACHTVHHLYFNYNYGQFCTLWDRLGGTYREPDPELFNPKARTDKNVWDKQAKEMDQIREEVEGEKDDRVYLTEEAMLEVKRNQELLEKKTE